MSTTTTTATSISDIHVGQTVRTKTGKLDWKVTKVTDKIVTYVRTDMGGRLQLKIATRRDIIRGELRTITYA